jgi:hypothetical protein
MCNLYSITTNQAEIIALFRVINRYVGNLPPMPGVFPDYPGAGDPQHRHRDGDDAMGHDATAAQCWPAGHHYPQHHLAALARPVEARKPVPSFDLLCVRAIGRCGVE